MSATTMRAGYAAVDITPGRDCRLLGYPFPARDLPTPNAGVLDPLHARVLVVEDPGGRAAIVSLETAIVSLAYGRHLRHVVAAAVDTTPDRVLVACTHTHSGPDLEEPSDAYTGAAAVPTAGSWSLDSPGQRYMAELTRNVAAASAHAAGLLYPVELRTAQAPLGLAYNRRVATPERMRHCWNPQEWPDLLPGPSRDPACTVLAFVQTNGQRRFVVWSAGAHPVVLGKTSRVISADWPGRACRVIEQGAPGTQALFLCGACGDAHPWVATQADPAGVDVVGNAAGAFVNLLLCALRPAGAQTIAVRNRTWTHAGAALELAGWRLGGAWLAASPVELFTTLSAELRTRVAGHGIVATCANGWTGYWPDRAAFQAGGYEINAAIQTGLTAGDGEQLVDHLAALLKDEACSYAGSPIHS